MFAERDGDGFGAVRHAEFGEKCDEMRLDAGDADAELFGDVVIRKATRERGQNLLLPG